GDERLAALLEAPGVREAETVHVEADRRVDMGHVEDGTGEPVGHVCLCQTEVAWGARRNKSPLPTLMRNRIMAAPRSSGSRNCACRAIPPRSASRRSPRARWPARRPCRPEARG